MITVAIMIASTAMVVVVTMAFSAVFVIQVLVHSLVSTAQHPFADDAGHSAGDVDHGLLRAVQRDLQRWVCLDPQWTSIKGLIGSIRWYLGCLKG